jgi:anti-anti-sigma regulatory factor
MAMNWVFEKRQGVGVLELRGYLGDSALARFSGAIGWALARCVGPVVIDLTSLQGCSVSGQAALEEAAERAAARGRVLAVCGPHGIATRQGPHGRQAAIPVYADLNAAVTALSAEPLPPLPPPRRATGRASQGEIHAG